MKNLVNKEKVEKAVYDFLMAIGENPERDGLKETPKRVANMCEEIFDGIKYSNTEIAEMFNKSFEHTDRDIIIMREIPAFSYCEHHLSLMYNMKITVAYLPNGKVLGLSKIARIADMVTKRLQLQERIGSDIAEVISIACDTEDVAVYIESEHSCMTARGIRKTGVVTDTYIIRGKFKTDESLKNEFLASIKKF